MDGFACCAHWWIARSLWTPNISRTSRRGCCSSCYGPSSMLRTTLTDFLPISDHSDYHTPHVKYAEHCKSPTTNLLSALAKLGANCFFYPLLQQVYCIHCPQYVNYRDMEFFLGLNSRLILSVVVSNKLEYEDWSSWN